MQGRFTLYLALLAAASLCQPALAGDIAHGMALYKAQCAACHSPIYNGVGPAHKGVFGRLAGSAPAYAYSPALKGSGIVWTADKLDAWLRDPEQLVPGQKMGVSVAAAQDRSDLIAYLQTLNAKP